MLSERFEYEKQKLVANLGSSEHANPEANSAACCTFLPEILCRESWFKSWQDTLALSDSTSFSLDMELLQGLSSILLVDRKGLEPVNLVKLHHSLYIFGTCLLNIIELYHILLFLLQLIEFERI
jgi:hypothetical protein